MKNLYLFFLIPSMVLGQIISTPPPIPVTVLNHAKALNDVDMNGYKLNNLDGSNIIATAGALKFLDIIPFCNDRNPQDGQVVMYNAGTNQFEPANAYSTSGGTVTMVSAEHDSADPLFTLDVTTPTQEPHIIPTLRQAPPFTLWGNPTASTDDPQYFEFNLGNLGQWAQKAVPTYDPVGTQDNQELTTKIIDSTKNNIVVRHYLRFDKPSNYGSSVTIQNTTSSPYYLQAKFDNGAGVTNNYVEYRTTVPSDFYNSAFQPPGTTIPVHGLRARFKIRLANNDNQAQKYVISFASLPDSASYDSSPGNPINMVKNGDGSGASGDVETVGWTSLPGWQDLWTPGNYLVIRIARDGGSGQDTSAVDSWSGPMEIEYDALMRSVDTYFTPPSPTPGPTFTPASPSPSPTPTSTPITVIHSYDIPGSGSDTVPSGVTKLVVETWGAGAGGANGNPGTVNGGGAGGHVSKTITISPSQWGTTYSYTVGAHGVGGVYSSLNLALRSGSNGTASSVTGTNVNIASNGGAGGLYNGGGGAGGTASGGDVNQKGGNGNTSAGGSAPSGGQGGGRGIAGKIPGGGGGPSDTSSNPAANGADGRVRFVYTQNGT